MLVHTSPDWIYQDAVSFKLVSGIWWNYHTIFQQSSPNLMFVHNESAHMNFDGLPSVLLVPLINQLANLAVPIIWTVGEFS